MIPWLHAKQAFPSPERALREPNGLLVAGGELSPERLIEAYGKGIFPWFSPGEPILWWSPDPRMVMFPAELKVSRSLRRTLKKGDYEVRADTAFESVMRGCGEPRAGQDGTWIGEAMIAAYVRLFAAGIAHSVETWREGKLIGGLYGVALGQMFYGESMFARATDASKIAFVHLVRQLERWEFGMIDCQMKTAHLASLGAREIPRREFLQRLGQLVEFPREAGCWRFDRDLVA